MLVALPVWGYAAVLAPRRQPTTARPSPRARQPLQAQERQLVPVAALERDLPLDDVEKAAAAQAQRVAPLENRPLAVLEQVFHDAHHLCGGESRGEHLADGVPAVDGTFSHLMVDRVVGIEGGQGVG